MTIIDYLLYLNEQCFKININIFNFKCSTHALTHTHRFIRTLKYENKINSFGI